MSSVLAPFFWVFRVRHDLRVVVLVSIPFVLAALTGGSVLIWAMAVMRLKLFFLPATAAVFVAGVALCLAGLFITLHIHHECSKAMEEQGR